MAYNNYLYFLPNHHTPNNDSIQAKSVTASGDARVAAGASGVGRVIPDAAGKAGAVGTATGAAATAAVAGAAGEAATNTASSTTAASSTAVAQQTTADTNIDAGIYGVASMEPDEMLAQMGLPIDEMRLEVIRGLLYRGEVPRKEVIEEYVSQLKKVEYIANNLTEEAAYDAANTLLKRKRIENGRTTQADENETRHAANAMADSFIKLAGAQKTASRSSSDSRVERYTEQSTNNRVTEVPDTTAPASDWAVDIDELYGILVNLSLKNCKNNAVLDIPGEYVPVREVPEELVQSAYEDVIRHFMPNDKVILPTNNAAKQSSDEIEKGEWRNPPADAANKGRAAVRMMIALDIPVTKRNLSAILSYHAKIEALRDVTPDAAAVAVLNSSGAGGAVDGTGYKGSAGNEGSGGISSEITVDALLSAASYTKSMKTPAVTEKTIEVLEDQIRALFEKSGISWDKTHKDIAKAILRNNGGITTENMRIIEELLTDVDTLVAGNSEELAALLYKKGIEPGTAAIELLGGIDKLLRRMRQINSTQVRSFVQGYKPGLYIGGYQNSGTDALYGSTPASDAVLSKLEGRIAELLGTEDLTPEAVDAAKALIRSGLDVNAENVKQLLGIAKKLNDMGASFESLSKIREQGEPVELEEIDKLIGSLRDSGRVIVEAHSQNDRRLARIDRLVDMIGKLRVNDFSAIASLMKSGVPITIKNLTMAYTADNTRVDALVDVNTDTAANVGAEAGVRIAVSNKQTVAVGTQVTVPSSTASATDGFSSVRVTQAIVSDNKAEFIEPVSARANAADALPATGNINVADALTATGKAIAAVALPATGNPNDAADALPAAESDATANVDATADTTSATDINTATARENAVSVVSIIAMSRKRDFFSASAYLYARGISIEDTGVRTISPLLSATLEAISRQNANSAYREAMSFKSDIARRTQQAYIEPERADYADGTNNEYKVSDGVGYKNDDGGSSSQPGRKNGGKRKTGAGYGYGASNGGTSRTGESVSGRRGVKKATERVESLRKDYEDIIKSAAEEVAGLRASNKKSEAAQGGVSDTAIGVIGGIVVTKVPSGSDARAADARAADARAADASTSAETDGYGARDVSSGSSGNLDAENMAVQQTRASTEQNSRRNSVDDSFGGMFSRILSSVAQLKDMGISRLTWLLQGGASPAADALAAARHVAENSFSVSRGLIMLEDILGGARSGGHGVSDGHGGASGHEGGGGGSGDGGSGGGNRSGSYAGPDGGRAGGVGYGQIGAGGQNTGGVGFGQLSGRNTYNENAAWADSGGNSRAYGNASAGSGPDESSNRAGSSPFLGAGTNAGAGGSFYGSNPGGTWNNGASDGGESRFGAFGAMSDSDRNTLLREFSKIRDILPGTDLSTLKNGADISDIYRELKARLLDIENKLQRSGAKEGDPVMKIVSSMKDNVSAQEQLNRNQACFQIPFLYHQKPTSLTVYVFDRKSGGRGKKTGEALSVSLNLETETLGTVDIGMKVSEKRVDLDIAVGTRRVRDYLDGIKDELRVRVRDAGFSVGDVTCEVKGAADVKLTGTAVTSVGAGTDAGVADELSARRMAADARRVRSRVARSGKTAVAGVDFRI